MPATPVVTCFLRNRGDVLLVRRSDAVGSYAGRWGAVSGHVARSGVDPTEPDREPLAAARAEVAEETGVLDACELARAGDPFDVEDPDHGTWRVHPFLFDCESRAVEPNEEAAEVAWVAPTELLRRKTVPGLWTSYDRVRPTVETVRANREHGSAALSVRALAVLRDRAGELAAGDDHPDEGAWATFADLAGELVHARPGMAALANRVNRVMATVDERTPAAVERRAGDAMAAALSADEAAAAVAADRLSGTVLTLSRSGTVLAALREADLDGVVVATSHPGGEGVGVAERLRAAGADVTLVPDATVAHHLGTAAVDAVVVGADAVLPDGGVVNKVGTRAAALAAAREGVPLLAVAARDKVLPAAPDGERAPDLGSVDRAAVYDGDADIEVATPLFDVTPPELVDAVVTEDGALAPGDVERVAAAHRELAAWRA
jgi:translation initiation factor 2B subunit (eIF-2B alpha/beta/delta family)/ADP-ribose pyrophosphatase YjhB (NUDIX family)